MKLLISKKLLIIAGLASGFVFAGTGIYMANQASPRSPAAVTDAQVSKRVVKKRRPSDQALVQEALRPRQQEIEGCYKKYLKGRPQKVEGDVQISWLINRAGAVLSTRIGDSEIDDERFTGCILQKLQGVTFAPPPDQRETFIAHKFRFRAEATRHFSFD